MAVIQIEMWYARLGCHGLCSGSIEQVHERRAPPVVESNNGVQTRGPLATKDASHQDPVENDNGDDEKTRLSIPRAARSGGGVCSGHEGAC